MYSPLHATAGLLLVHTTPNPIVGLGLAFLSHYVLDAVPHGDENPPATFKGLTQGKRILLIESVDLPVTIFLVWWLTQHLTGSTSLLWAGALAGILPDILWASAFVLKKIGWNIPLLTRLLEIHDRWHARTHVKKSNDIPFVAGVAYHLAVIAGVLIFVR
jgi:hypothetical protein